ncbi:MAG: tRNA (adenosine(37)-N6)-threonylcarbamoyltransferase complex transferase subunit TsaD [Candidatus Yanofskybacteria bacterium RIFCSPHIGHO2_01_FULL_44_17]|uniref:tRNA N6-adenosine threonylcarbamoyltransferase n=1 Tax=Candidatus Yanofskybacteria bacterium RIFCSPHIGHO2_01_FULL_44_17 TaxID=1802668 RepID=A0A1F8EV88_9BACT|nr:MAG: tRNA (adenosine(37)-N6)-threonylcarbamoyltransferase complex transferase subunit TsaD [Candidatus Yanofskybacteria bacterium RIFCSPHIGHO2_01_FULL_44_17]
MLILGIETSCDDTAASLLEVRNNSLKVLSSIISSQIKLHAKYGGVFPSLAAREHVKNLPGVIKLALTKKHLKDIDVIAVTRGPGLISSLLVGTAFAQTLAWKYNKPLVGVNHLEGHLASNWLPQASNNQKKAATNNHLPAMCLIVSGGHTELVLMTGINKYKLVGHTLDDAAGEAFDKIARILGLGYPGGPAVAATAAKLKVGGEKLKIKLPRPMLHSKDLNFSFAGLKTAVLYLTRDLTKNKKRLSPQIRAAIAAEAQQAIVDVLVIKTILAAEKYKVKSVMLSGGVSANKLLRSELENASTKKGLKFFRPKMDYTTDNATMIALAGYWRWKLKKQKTDWKSVQVDANLDL